MRPKKGSSPETKRAVQGTHNPNPGQGQIKPLGDGSVEDRPALLFRKLDARATFLFQKYTAQTEITQRQFVVLFVLLQEGRLTQSELSEQASIDKSTLGEMVQRMTDRGLLGSVVGQNDRRTTELWLTEAGRSVCLALVPMAREAQRALIDPLPVEYRLLFMKCLKILAAAPD